MALSLLIHVALLWSGRDAFEPQPGAPPSANPNLQVVVRAPGPKPSSESVSRMPAPKLAHRIPPTDSPEPVEGRGQRELSLVPAVDRAEPMAPPSRAEGPQPGGPAAETARPAAPDRNLAASVSEWVTEPAVVAGQPGQAVVPEDVVAYRIRLVAHARSFKEFYPPLARERGLAGEVGVRVRIGPNLAQPEVTLGKSSGVAILDDAAVAMIAKASRAVDLPVRLRGRAAEIDMQVSYGLVD